LARDPNTLESFNPLILCELYNINRKKERG